MAFVTTVALLARECNVKPNDVIAAAQRAGIPVSRVAAQLTESQAIKIRAGLRTRPPKTSHSFHPPTSVRSGTISGAFIRPVRTPLTGPDECSCCGLRITPGDASDLYLPLSNCCRRCEDHYEVDGEPMSRKVTRLAEHEARIRAARADALKAAALARDQRAYAFDSRDRYRRVLVELLKLHQEKEDKLICAECGEPYPCAIWASLRLRSINRGIYDRIALLVALDDNEDEGHGDGDDYRESEWEALRT